MKELIINSTDRKYECFLLPDETLLFEKTLENVTHNAVNFIAITHAIAYQLKNNTMWTIYSNNPIAINWVKHKEAKTENKTEIVLRAEKFLKENDFSQIPIERYEGDFIRKRKVVEKLKELDAIFNNYTIPSTFYLNDATYITNTRKFIENNKYIALHGGKAVSDSSLYLLQQFAEKIKEHYDKK